MWMARHAILISFTFRHYSIQTILTLFYIDTSFWI